MNRATGPQLPRVATGARRGALARLVANGIAQAIMAVLSGLLVGRAFLLVVEPGASTAQALVVGGGLLATGTAMGLLRWVERVDAEHLGQSYVHEIRVGVLSHILQISPRDMAARSTGSTALRFTGDVSALRLWVSRGLARVLVGAPLVLGCLAVLVVVSPLVGAAAAVVVAIGGAASHQQSGQLRAVSRNARRARGRLAADVTERVAAHAVVVAHGQGSRERRRVARRSRTLRDAMVERADVSGRVRGLAEAVGAATTAAVVTAGVVAGVGGPALVTALTVAGFLVAPLRDLARSQEYYHGAKVARERIEDVLARPRAAAHRLDGGGEALRPGPGRLEVSGLRLDGVLDGVDARAEPGQVVAVVGGNGSGKSTLLSALAQLVDVDGGRVVLDGQDLAGVRHQDVRAAIGVVSPDLPLLRGSVARNITYRAKVSPGQRAGVEALTGLGDVLAVLPDGERTRVGDGGRTLSSGQRLRIELTRALLGGPRLLLLDEADAHLDPESVAVVDRVMETYKGTILLVTHNMERAARADVVWRLEEGRLDVIAPAEHRPAG